MSEITKFMPSCLFCNRGQMDNANDFITGNFNMLRSFTVICMTALRIQFCLMAEFTVANKMRVRNEEFREIGILWVIIVCSTWQDYQPMKSERKIYWPTKVRQRSEA